MDGQMDARGNSSTGGRGGGGDKGGGTNRYTVSACWLGGINGGVHVRSCDRSGTKRLLNAPLSASLNMIQEKTKKSVLQSKSVVISAEIQRFFLHEREHNDMLNKKASQLSVRE